MVVLSSVCLHTCIYIIKNVNRVLGTVESGNEVALQLSYHELDPLNPLSRELELADNQPFLFFGKTNHGNGVYHLILFPRNVKSSKKSDQINLLQLVDNLKLASVED